MSGDSNPEDEWPPPDARLQGILWRAEDHIGRCEFLPASLALAEGLGLGDDELVRGLHHLAAAGYKTQIGEPERARRQLAHARRRLAQFVPERRSVAVAALLSAVERVVEKTDLPRATKD